MTLITYLLLAVVVTMASSLPLGPVNLSVVSITINKSKRKAMEFSISAALIEPLIALSALYFGKSIHLFFEMNCWVQIAIFIIFYCSWVL